MDSQPNVPLILFLALLGMFAIFGPPAWWYWHGKKPGERRERRWQAILLGALLIITIGRIGPTVKGDWLGWAISIARISAGAWLIAWGARGSTPV
jgi:hypothetical protein